MDGESSYYLHEKMLAEKHDQPGMGGERWLPSLPQGVATAGWIIALNNNNNFLVLHTYNDKGIKV